MSKKLSWQGEQRLLLLYQENNLKGNNIFPAYFITLYKWGYVSNDRINGIFIRRVTNRGIDYLKRRGLIA